MKWNACTEEWEPCEETQVEPLFSTWTTPRATSLTTFDPVEHTELATKEAAMLEEMLGLMRELREDMKSLQGDVRSLRHDVDRIDLPRRK